MNLALHPNADFAAAANQLVAAGSLPTAYATTGALLLPTAQNCWVTVYDRAFASPDNTFGPTLFHVGGTPPEETLRELAKQMGIAYPLAQVAPASALQLWQLNELLKMPEVSLEEYAQGVAAEARFNFDTAAAAIGELATRITARRAADNAAFGVSGEAYKLVA